MAMSVIDNIAKSVGTRFKGFLATFDMLPPLYVRFHWNPTEYTDNFNPEYVSIKTPAGGFPVAQFVGMSDRIVSFKLRFDSWNPDSCWAAKSIVAEHIRQVRESSTYTPDSILGRASKVAKPLSVPLAAIELMKMPRPQLVRFALSFTNSFKKLGFAGSKPSPPICILGLSIDKVVMGFVKKADIRPLKFNTLMQIIRAEVDIEFLVQDSFLTYIEDTLRLLNGALSIQNLWKPEV